MQAGNPNNGNRSIGVVVLSDLNSTYFHYKIRYFAYLTSLEIKFIPSRSTLAFAILTIFTTIKHTIITAPQLGLLITTIHRGAKPPTDRTESRFSTSRLRVVEVKHRDNQSLSLAAAAELESGCLSLNWSEWRALVGKTPHRLRNKLKAQFRELSPIHWILEVIGNQMASQELLQNKGQEQD